jgi:DNA-binding CsgD family transcriptional regulator/predicted ester cyclase
MSSDHKARVIRWYHGLWNERRAEIVEEMMAPDCAVVLEGRDTPASPEEMKGYWRAMVTAIPDLHLELLFVVCEGDTAITHWRSRGTHTGPGLGIPPTGRSVDVQGLGVMEFRDGLIVRGFDRWNRGEFMARLMEPTPQDVAEGSQLTAREAQVALLMAERYSHVEIATTLGISPNTARRHCERVLAKLGVSRRQDVAGALGKVSASVLNPHGSDLAGA